MLEVNKVTSDEIKNMFDVLLEEEIYSLSFNQKNIGYGIIRNSIDNNIELYILKDYQGNGYGTYLFKYLLNIITHDVMLKTDINNTIVNRIIKNNNGIELGRDGHNIYYIIKKTYKK